MENRGIGITVVGALLVVGIVVLAVLAVRWLSEQDRNSLKQE
jgi:hypothetical protein